MKLDIRFFKKEDITETTKLVNEFFEIKDVVNGYNKIIANGLKKSLIAIYNQKIVGHILIDEKYNSKEDKLFYWLSYVCVKKEYQNQGIATAMLKEIEKMAKKNNICYIKFTSANWRKSAHACYQKLEYQIVDTTVFQKNICIDHKF